MKIILLKDVPKIGRKYEVKNVADGYALNMLIPRGLGQVATPQALKRIELMKAEDAVQKKIHTELLIQSLETIRALKINLKEKANEKGHLFAGVTKDVIHAEILKATRLNLDPETIKLPKPLKEVGEYKITVEAEGNKAEFVVNIEAK